MDESDRTDAEGRAPAPSAPNRDPERPHPIGRDIGRINLAHEAPTRLGALSIEPALRRVAHDDGREEIAEPRVMQVLVALIRADGRILSRDDLLMSCWHGVVVGEDAVNRVMGRVRRLADGIGGGAFKLETITKVGYRLVSTDPQVRIPPSASAADGQSPAPAAATEPLLAVLAFDNLCEGADMAWFSDGVSEEIQQTVARAADLRVIGRASSFQFRGAEKAAARVASMLRATHVLDGSVRRSGDTVRISAELIACAGETTLWSGRFDRVLSDVFALQDEIAAAVAAALKIAFAPAAKSEAIDPAAYDLYLRARESWNTFLSAATRVAVTRLLERATDLAPRFARAWAFLAAVRAMRLRSDKPEEPYETLRSKVVVAAETALMLDQGLGEVYQTLSHLEPFGAYLSRERLHMKALSVTPNDPTVLTNAAVLCAEVGRINEALGYAKQAHDLDPMYPWAASWCAIIFDYAGRSEESRVLQERCRALWPDNEYIAWHAIASAVGNADWAWFDELVEATRGLNNEFIRGMVWFGRNLRDPNPQSLKRYLERTREGVVSRGTLPFGALVTLYRLGATKETFDLIDEASFTYMFDSEQRSPNSVNLSIIFSAAHNTDMMRDPRFPRLCAKLGLCDYWVKTERWPDCAEAVGPYYDFKTEARRLAADNGRASA